MSEKATCTPASDDLRSEFWQTLEAAPGKEPYKLGSKTVYACEMSFDDWIAYQIAIADSNEDEGLTPSKPKAYAASHTRKRAAAFLLVHCVADENGKLIWSVKDVPRLMRGRWQPLSALHLLCLKVNRLDAESADEAKKNSEAAESTGCSDSPTTDDAKTPETPSPA